MFPVSICTTNVNFKTDDLVFVFISRNHSGLLVLTLFLIDRLQSGVKDEGVNVGLKDNCAYSL